MRTSVRSRAFGLACLGLVFTWQGCFDTEHVDGEGDGDGPSRGGEAGEGVGGARSGAGGNAGRAGDGGGSATSGAAGSDGGAGADTGGSGGSSGSSGSGGTAGDGGGEPGIAVEPTSGLRTSEEGEATTFTVRLRSRPTSNVSIRLSSDDTSEGTVAPAMLTFTVDNWSAPQVVTATGVDDDSADGTASYTVVTAPATSDDADYEGRDADDVELENIDDETPGIRVDAEPDLETSESGAQATFTVRLNSEPSVNVTLDLEVSDSTEGSVAPTRLVFSPQSWRATQLVTVTGVNDSLEDGAQVYRVTGAATSTDAGYDGASMPDVVLTNVDNDVAGVSIGPVSGDTTEGGGQATFTMALNSEPSADVVIRLSSSDTGEGTVAPSSLRFTTTDWSSPQTVRVTGVDDDAVDGRQPYAIVTSAPESTDAAYANLSVPDVELYNRDDDSPGVIVGAPSGNTSEWGGQATFTVRLQSAPSSNVSIALSSSDTGEGRVSPASVAFTSGDWDDPQTVTVTGQDDAIEDGPQPYNIVTGAATSSDAAYSDLPVPYVPLTNVDDDDALGSMSAFDGRGLLVPCATNPAPRNARNCYNNLNGEICTGAGTQRVDQFILGGNPASVYDVTLRVRGVSELKLYTGGARRTATGTQDGWYVGGTPSTATPPYNMSRITISDPPQTYYFNSGPDASYSRWEVFALDYQVTIQARGGATVQLANTDSNCEQIKNCGAPEIPQTQCVPMTLPSFSDPRISQPYNGQFIVLELLQARPR